MIVNTFAHNKKLKRHVCWPMMGEKNLNSKNKYDIGAANRCSDVYKMTPFLQSTRAWRFRVENEQK